MKSLSCSFRVDSPVQRQCTPAVPSRLHENLSHGAATLRTGPDRHLPDPLRHSHVCRVAAAPAPSVTDSTEADAGWSYGQAALQGPRDTMEDFTSVTPSGRCGFLVASLFDGHSGPYAADWLNTRLYELFSEAINEEMFDEPAEDGACEVEGLDRSTGLCCPVGVRDTLAQSFQDADELLLKELKGLEDEEERMAGSTATVALVRRDKIIVANVGDSRAVLCRRGQAIDLTTEHRVYGSGPVVDAEEARVKAAGGWVADGRVCDIIAVSRAFGDLQFKEDAGRQQMLQFGVEVGQWDEEFAQSVHFKESPIVATPDVTEMILGDEDEFVVIASDGLWDVMNSRDVINFARQNFKKRLDAQAVADKLAKVAMQRHTTDNVAVIVVALDGNGTSFGRTKQKQPGLLTRMFR